MKKKSIIWVIALCSVFLLALYGCHIIIDKAFPNREIEDGFNDKWLKILKKEYNITVPKSAVYQKGFYEPGIDFSVHMLFTVKGYDLDRMLGKGWTKEIREITFGDEWYANLTDLELPHRYIYRKKYTVLFYSEASEDHTVTCVFIGWRP